jgi:ankyrin repeat protein
MSIFVILSQATPLIVATKAENIKTIQELLGHKASVLITDDQGNTRDNMA